MPAFLLVRLGRELSTADGLAEGFYRVRLGREFYRVRFAIEFYRVLQPGTSPACFLTTACGALYCVMARVFRNRHLTKYTKCGAAVYNPLYVVTSCVSALILVLSRYCRS